MNWKAQLEAWRRSLAYQLVTAFIFQGEGFVQFCVSNQTFAHGKRWIVLVIVPGDVVETLGENPHRVFSHHEIQALRARSLRRAEKRDLDLIETRPNWMAPL